MAEETQTPERIYRSYLVTYAKVRSGHVLDTSDHNSYVTSNAAALALAVEDARAGSLRPMHAVVADVKRLTGDMT